MDFRQLEYIIAIADEGNITKAARKMYITQSALNQQLLKLEKEIGGELFKRSKINMTLTEIGEIYVAKAKEVLEIKRDTYNQIDNIMKKYKGTIRLGLTPDRGMLMFVSVYKNIHKLYPHVKIVPVEASVKLQYKMIENGDLDLGLVNLTEDEKGKYSYFSIAKENLVLAVPKKEDILRRRGFISKKISIVELSLLKNKDFVFLSQGTTIRKVIDSYFQKAGYTPEILFESNSSQTLLKMVENNLACTIISEFYANSSEHMEYYSFVEETELEYCAIYKKGRYITELMKKMIELFRNYWERSI